MSDQEAQTDEHQRDGAATPPPPEGHAIIAGFGVPGRAVADRLAAAGVPFVVVELNAQTVMRCGGTGLHIIAGDAADEQTLLRAGIERAVLFAVTVPVDAAVLASVAAARRSAERGGGGGCGGVGGGGG
ncbi:MAG: NAD-binding protein, partial [Actinobacteria bacterium]|nr:NAD-binding protein [Actinomycetota bacterium]